MASTRWWLGIIVLVACARPAPPPLPPGSRGAIAEVDLEALDHRRVMLTTYRSEVTVIALWATWCEPCLHELPRLEALHRSYAGDRRVSVVALSIDDPSEVAKIQKVVTSHGVTFPVLLDAQRSFVRRFVDGRKIGLPLLYIIDSRSRGVVERGFALGQTVEQFLAEKRSIIDRALAGAFTDDMEPIAPAL